MIEEDEIFRWLSKFADRMGWELSKRAEKCEMRLCVRSAGHGGACVHGDLGPAEWVDPKANWTEAQINESTRIMEALLDARCPAAECEDM